MSPDEKDRILDAYAAKLAGRLDGMLARLPQSDPSWVSERTSSRVARNRALAARRIDRLIQETLEDWA